MKAIVPLAGLLLAVPVQGDPAAALCDGRTDKAVFSCPSGRRTIAVCASTAEPSKLVYKFGTPGRVELTAKHGMFGLITLSGGGGSTLRFASGEHEYVVYSATTRSGDKAGVFVRAKGRKVADVRCTGEPSPDLDPEVLEHSGAPRDPQVFELP